MEIQQGKGPWASPVSGIVPLGTTLTMVVGIDDKQGQLKSWKTWSMLSHFSALNCPWPKPLVATLA